LVQLLDEHVDHRLRGGEHDYVRAHEYGAAADLRHKRGRQYAERVERLLERDDSDRVRVRLVALLELDRSVDVLVDLRSDLLLLHGGLGRRGVLPARPGDGLE